MFRFIIICLVLQTMSITMVSGQSSVEKVDDYIAKATKNLSDINLLKAYTDSAAILSKKIAYPKGMAMAAKFNGIYYYFTSKHDSSLLAYRQSLELFESINDSLETAKALLNLATTYSALAAYDETTDFALRSLRYFESMQEYNGTGRALNLLGIVAYNRKDFQSALGYFKKHLKNSVTVNDSLEIASSYNNMASAYNELEQRDSAYLYFEKSLSLKENLGMIQNLGNVYQNLGGMYSDDGEFAHAREYFQKALEVYGQMGNQRNIAIVWVNLGLDYMKQNKYIEAEKAFNKSIEASLEGENAEMLKKGYESLSGLFEKQGNFASALQAFKRYHQVSDSLLNVYRINRIEELAAEYESEKKEQQIQIQEASINAQQLVIQRNSIIIFALLTVAVLLLLIVLLNKRSSKRKQKIMRQEQEIKVKEASLHAALTSQEKERKRFARDLHDGFGQLISSLKMQIDRLNDTNDLAQRASIFDASAEIITDMHKEIRNIAFDLMPAVLIQYGLVAAVKEFANRINSTEKIKVFVGAYELNDRLTELQEINLYRVIQEWINNILKYSNATAIDIQLVKHEKNLNIMIEDNGSGFNPQKLSTVNGNGWKNIQSRMQLINGSVDVDSMEGIQGTTLILEIPASKSENKTGTMAFQQNFN
ncbi:MAG: tetratricopeptide repeat protein [Cyclobacteriaceae bacterium]|nr:tetratricopeptide repeat protein [Cyclobacteriaceae bacterium]